MKKIGLMLNFIVGCAVLFAAFTIGWANWGNLLNQLIIMQTLMGALVIVVLFLVLMAILSKGKDRWRALTLGGILLLGFSALVFFSVGWMAAPFALFLFVFSLLKLRRGETEHVTG